MGVKSGASVVTELMSKEVKINVPIKLKGHVELIIKDKNDNVLQQSRQKMRCFVRQFIDMLFLTAAHIYETPGYSIRDVTNTLRSCYFSTNLMRCAPTVGQNNTNIVVGTDDGTITPLAIDNFNLGAIIAHGTGGGQLQYSAATYGATTTVAGVSSFRMTRVFSNNSGASISAKEVGIKCSNHTTQYFLIARDLPGTYAVGNGETLTVNYDIEADIADYLLRNFIKFLQAKLSSTNTNGEESLYDTGYNSRKAYYYSPSIFNVGGGDSSYVLSVTNDSQDNIGIQVGVGDTAVDAEDYALDDRVDHGFDSAELNYLGHGYKEPYINPGDASVCQFDCWRYFYNESGGLITLLETGFVIYAIGYFAINAYYYPFLIGRKVISQAVADQELCKVTWTFSVDAD